MLKLPVRLPILLTALLLLGACSTRTTPESRPEVVLQSGIITAREEIDLDQVESKSEAKTSVYASVSSGRGIAIGLGFLLSPLFASQDDPPLRYEIKLNNGELATVYHHNPDFAIGDCVEVEMSPGETDKAPKMRRNEGAC